MTSLPVATGARAQLGPSGAGAFRGWGLPGLGPCRGTGRPGRKSHRTGAGNRAGTDEHAPYQHAPYQHADTRSGQRE
jgi:hypothetical protein